jgi:transglutaminase-like putative cysteine protease
MFKLTKTTFEAIGSGEQGVIDTLKIMRREIIKGKQSPLIRQFTANLVNGLRQKDYIGEVRKIHEFVRDNIRYVKDIDGVETVHGAEFILKNRYGDCDDKSILVASMLLSIGHPCAIVACGFIEKMFSHVYVITKIGEKWVPVETTEQVALGWQPTGQSCRKICHIK